MYVKGGDTTSSEVSPLVARSLNNKVTKLLEACNNQLWKLYLHMGGGMLVN